MKRIWILVLVILMILVIFLVSKLIDKGDSTVKFLVPDQENVPQEITNKLMSYKEQERALCLSFNGEIYVVVTRGEKRTTGYTVAIAEIKKVDKEDNFELVVYATYKDPKPGSIVAQVITYPAIIVKTDLKRLPDKIILEADY